jgi:hypothetical protein
MGVEMAVWRAKIGCFAQPIKKPGSKPPAIRLSKGACRALIWTILLCTICLHNSVAHMPSRGLVDIIPSRSVYPCNLSLTCVSGVTMTNSGSDHVYLVIEAALVCSGLETNPGPTTDGLSYCIEQCKHGRKDIGEMIRCCLCAKWFHQVCINIPDSELTGVWPCMECRQINSRLVILMENMNQLTSAVGSALNRLDKAESVWREQKEQLTIENTDLQKTIFDLNKETNAAKWQSFINKDTNKSVVIGDSIIRDIDKQKLEDTMVVSKPRGCITDIQDSVRELPGGHDELTLVVGGNDCDSKPSKTADDIIKGYDTLLVEAKSKARQVFVSSICPRIPSQETNDKIDAVNAGLNVICSDRNVVFIDNAPSFHLGDGAINDGYFVPDGIHLNRAAVNKLAQNLKLKVKDKAEGACKDMSNRTGRPTKDANKNDNTSRSFASRGHINARHEGVFSRRRKELSIKRRVW